MAAYRIVNTVQTVDFTPAGQFLDVWEITYELTESGAQGTVKVPARDFIPDQVARVVQESANNLAAIQDLTGG